MMLDKSDISAIYLILYYWKSAGGKMMLKVTGLHGLGDEAVEYEDAEIDYPDTLEI